MYMDTNEMNITDIDLTNVPTLAAGDSTCLTRYEDRVRCAHLEEPISGTIRMSLDNRHTFKEFLNSLHAISRATTKVKMLMMIKNVIFNDPATIVFWNDGTKTVVKCENEKFDPEKGLAMAISKKLLGDNQGCYYDVFKKWLPKK